MNRRGGSLLRSLGTAVALVLAGCTLTPARTPPVPATSPAAAASASPGSARSGSPTGPDGSSRPASTTAAPTRPATTQRIVFGDPWSKVRSEVHAVVGSALEIIASAVAGQTLTLSMFNLTYPGTADALVAAHRRGVSVHILVNREGAVRSREVHQLQRDLGRDTARRSWIRIRGGGFRMHAKFLLLSASPGAPVLAWISSGNLTRANGRFQANEALITTGDRGLYDFLHEQFELMLAGETDPARLARSVRTATASVQTFPQPSLAAAGDPALQLLSDITCRTAAGTTTVRVAHLFLTEERQGVAERLRRLRTEGCTVSVIGHLSVWSREARRTLLGEGPGRIDLRDSVGAALHTKIITIDGWDGSGEPLLTAMVGTHNLTGRALARTPDGVNDEFAITVTNLEVVRAYSDWVDRIIADHSRPAAA